MTWRVAIILDLNAPGRCTVALSRQTTVPNGVYIVGGELPGIAKEIG